MTEGTNEERTKIRKKQWLIEVRKEERHVNKEWHRIEIMKEKRETRENKIKEPKVYEWPERM